MTAIGSQPDTRINTSSDEYIIKDYNAASIKKPNKGEGHLVVTNKRAVIYYWTKKSVLVNDAQIAEITATNIFWGKRKRRITGIISFAIGIIWFLSLITIPFFSPLAFIGLVPIAFGIYLIFKERTTFVVTLYVKSVTDAISLNNYPTGGGISGMLGGLLAPSILKVEGKPGPDAEIMAKEIGALILDIQRGVVNK